MSSGGQFVVSPDRYLPADVNLSRTTAANAWPQARTTQSGRCERKPVVSTAAVASRPQGRLRGPCRREEAFRRIDSTINDIAASMSRLHEVLGPAPNQPDAFDETARDRLQRADRVNVLATGPALGATPRKMSAPSSTAFGFIGNRSISPTGDTRVRAGRRRPV
jgi:hypothetical protein